MAQGAGYTAVAAMTALCSYCLRVREIVHSSRRLGWGAVRYCAECVDKLAAHP